MRGEVAPQDKRERKRQIPLCAKYQAKRSEPGGSEEIELRRAMLNPARGRVQIAWTVKKGITRGTLLFASIKQRMLVRRAAEAESAEPKGKIYTGVD